MLRKFALSILLLLAAVLGYSYLSAIGLLGSHQEPGSAHPKGLPAAVVAEQTAVRQEAATSLGMDSSQQILFGDFHVHTTFSSDAYVASLPIAGGEGSHPPADACDYARYCSALDFWSINDHAVSLDQRRWREIKDSIRQCNAVADSDNPDVVAFLGYEWTQANAFDAKRHYGHKNVIFKHTDEERVARRPIFADIETGIAAFNLPLTARMLLPLARWKDRTAYHDWSRYITEMEDQAPCPDGVHSAKLSDDCKEGAATPTQLFRKLEEQGHDTIVIPHGNAWGFYTPAGTAWDEQLKGPMQNEKYQYLAEVFSGHGNNEEYRPWRPVNYDENSKAICPPETADYLPVCVQAGRIIKQRCLEAGDSEEECVAREKTAQQHAAESIWPLHTVGLSASDDWLDAGQCKDCFMPAYTYRPMSSLQYALAIGNFDDPQRVRRFRFGMMAASDNHTARPGTGYKESQRLHNIEGFGLPDPAIRKMVAAQMPPAEPFSRAVPNKDLSDAMASYAHGERAASYFITGGLIAVHAENRNREGIWNAVAAKQTYATSGDRILLWFDLLNADGDKTAPMGSELAMGENPRFRATAIGAFKQNPGCPAHSLGALGEQRLQRLCYGECYNPSDQRKRITRLEVIRIRPQLTEEEPVDGLIEDSWRTFDCPDTPEGCSVEFEDPDFVRDGRESLYYVRAIEEASDAINGNPAGCEYNAQGQCTTARHCPKLPSVVDPEDDCLSPVEERAWSSPIFIDYAEPARSAPWRPGEGPLQEGISTADID
ncbi:MAG: DUF3604 domain-containing protein [Halieaceae bacterium]|nr:DUF3604 domain-containing protein [Halieaceae bacterium]